MRWSALRSCSNSLTTAWVRPSKIFKNCISLHKLRLEVPAKFTTDVHGGGKDCEENGFTVASLARRWCRQFELERIPEPIESIEYIIAHVLGTTKVTELINLQEKELNTEQLEKLELLCNCRLSRMPVQYIIGEWDFRDITLKLEPPIFIPRPETEILVDLLLKRMEHLKKDVCRVLEIGCGSGAICLSVLHSNKNVNVVAIDINPQACELTSQNAKNLSLESNLIILNALLKEDATIEIKKNYSSKKLINLNQDKFDVIVSNPPYIPIKQVFKLQPEIILYEDIKALDGGDDGLKLIKPILKYASEALNVGGHLILEVDSSHPERIEFLVNKYYADKLKFEHVFKDFCNRDRVVEISKIQ